MKMIRIFLLGVSMSILIGGYLYGEERYEFQRKVKLSRWMIANVEEGKITAPEEKEGYLQFSGKPKHDAAAILVVVKDENWDKYSLVTIEVCPLVENMEKLDFRFAFEQDKKWYLAGPEIAATSWKERVYKGKLEKGKWTTLNFNISKLVRDKPDVFRLYFNRRGKFTGKVIKCELGKIIFMP